MVFRGFQKPYINSSCRYSRRAFRVLNISRVRDQTVFWAFSKINKHLLRLFQIHPPHDHCGRFLDPRIKFYIIVDSFKSLI